MPAGYVPLDETQALGSRIRAAMGGVQGDLASSRLGIQNDLAGGGMTAADAMRSPWQTQPAAPMTASDAMGMPSGGASTDARALAMGLSGANSESPREQARRILSGKSGAPEGGTDIMNAMGVSALRSDYLAQRAARIGISPYIPNSDTPPEIAQNNLNYLDLMTLKGAGSPLATHFDREVGSGGSTVDMRRAAVQAMADRGTASMMTPAERNRRAIIAAMTPAGAPGAPGAPAGQDARKTIEDIMLGYSKAGGTGLSIEGVMKGVDTDAKERAAAEKQPKPDANAEYDKMIDTYKAKLAAKDYVSARFWAQKLGHKFPSKDENGEPVEFSPEMLPGFAPDKAAPAAVPAAAAEATAVPTAAAEATAVPTADAIAHLWVNPDLAPAFDAKYGEGSAAKYAKRTRGS